MVPCERTWCFGSNAPPAAQLKVEVIRDGETRPYTAVPIDDPVEVDRLNARGKARIGAAAYYAARAMLLFASVKPVRLDPHQP